MTSELENNPRFQALSEAEKADYTGALAGATKVERIIVKELVWQGTQIGTLAAKCNQRCEERFHRMERFRSWLLGIGVGLGAIGIVSAILALIVRGSS